MKKWIIGIVLAGVITALFMALWSRGILDKWEYATWSWRVQLRAKPSPATDEIKIIMLDQGSLDWVYKELGITWPWPREIYGPIIQFCLRGGARSVAFDVLYTEPSARYGVADDEALGSAIASGPPFVAALYLGEELGSYETWPSFAPLRGVTLHGVDASLAHQLTMPRATFPIPEVVTNATMVADVKGSSDPDGIIRRSHVFRIFDGRAIPSLGLGAYLAAKYNPATGLFPEFTWDGHALQLDRRRIPLDAKGQAILRYRGPSGTHEKFSAAEIIRSEMLMQEGEMPDLSPIVFNNCYVFFGFSAPGLMDLRPTPLSPITPGVEIHATMLDNFLSNDFMRDPPQRIVLIATLILSLLAAWCVLYSRSALQTVFWSVIFLPLPVLGAFVLYDFNIWWPLTVQVLTVGFTLVGGGVINYATEGRQKAFIKSAFRHYLSPEVIDQIVKDPSQLQLGGVRRELSIFFSDLAGFSAISEKLEAQELTKLLNDYLSDMTDIVLEEGGTLDKYLGDAILAFWNAPLDQPDHAERAVRTALRCQRKLAERRAEFKERTGAEMAMRIGVNTGQVVVGNMGSRARFDYTVLGDTANLASRLEGANKHFGTETMIAESTWKQAEGTMIGREIGRITVVGRKTPERVYEVLGLPGETPKIPLADFERALQSISEANWKEALALFDQWTDDALSRKYADRCRALIAEPNETWDGVWNLTEK